MRFTSCIFSYLAGVAKRTFNIFYHFGFIYKNSALYQTDRRYTEIAERLPCRVSLFALHIRMLELNIIKSIVFHESRHLAGN